MSWPLEAALLHTAWFVLGVLVPGAALLALLLPAAEEAEGPKAFLRIAAAGALWNALQLGAVLLVRPPGPLPRGAVLAGVLASDALVAALALHTRRGRLAGLAGAASRGVSPVLLAAAIVCGFVALRAFPQVSDCLQLHWTENLVVGRPAGGNSGALGFSAWILFPGLFRPDLPLVSSGAGARIPLFLLTFVAGHALVRAAGVRRVAFGTGLYLLILLASYFGRVGLFELGKDSLAGLVFTVAFASALPRTHPGMGRGDRGLFLAAAVLLGVISFPFLAVLASLDLALRVPAGGTRSEFRTLALFAIPAVLPALGAMSQAPLLLITAVLTGAALFALALPERPLLIGWNSSGLAARLLPVACFAAFATAGASLMPLRLPMTVRHDAAKVPVIEAWPPLDGRTTFASYLLASGGTRYTPVAAAGILGVLVYLMRRPGRRDGSLTALALAPMVLSLLGLLLAVLPARPILPFHIWDLVKDVPLWLAGPIWGLFAVLAVDGAAGRFLEHLSDRALALGIGAAVLAGVTVKRNTLPWTFRPAILTSAAGHQDADVAALFQDVWDNRATTRSILAQNRSAVAGGRVLPDLWVYSYCGARDTGDDSPADLSLAPGDLPALVVVDPPGARRLLQSGRARIVRNFDTKGESLLRIEARPER